MIEPLNFNIGQGETFKLENQTLFENQKSLNYPVSASLPLDITNIEFVGQVKENYTTDEVSATFTIEKETPFESGSISIYLYPAETAALTLRTYVYDIIMINNNESPAEITRILEGSIIVRPSVTMNT